MASSTEHVRQAAALPIRNGKICLVTSSNGKRWVIPKGLIDPGHTAGQAALQEAWEEAGLTGVLAEEPSGSYLYEKWCGVCHVIVFVMHVIDAAEIWPEQDVRERVWLSPAAALQRIVDPGLADIVRQVFGKPARTAISI